MQVHPTATTLVRKEVDETMPQSFKKKYPKTRVILDATEVKIQVPRHKERQHMYSELPPPRGLTVILMIVQTNKRKF